MGATKNGSVGAAILALSAVGACHLIGNADDLEVGPSASTSTSLSTSSIGGAGGRGGAGGSGTAGGQGGAGMPSASAGGGMLPTECTASTDCGTNNECAVFTCADSKCSVAYAEKGTVCQASKACNGAGSCLLADGVDCTAKSECVSGFCEDARCCATSCGVCSTCAMAGMEGSCEPLPSGIADGLG